MRETCLCMMGLENKRGVDRHITAQQLLEGARALARERYGFLGAVVLKQMGIHFSEDFGEIVYQLIDLGLLQKLPSDSKEDFKNGFSLDEAFNDLYLDEARNDF